VSAADAVAQAEERTVVVEECDLMDTQPHSSGATSAIDWENSAVAGAVRA
jgi:hypothetical protein